MKQNVKWTKLFAILMLIISVLAGPLEAFAQDVSSASDVEEVVSSAVTDSSADATPSTDDTDAPQVDATSSDSEELDLSAAQFANVNGTVKELHNVVKSAIIWDYNNAKEAPKDTEGNYVLRQGSLFGFEMSFDLSDYNYILNNGDYFDYEIPAPLTVQEAEFALIDRPTGIAVGYAKVVSNGDQQGGSVHIELQNLEKYLEYKKAESAYGVKGSFFVQFRSDTIKTPITVRLKDKHVEGGVDIVLKVDERGPDSSNGPYLATENFNKYWGVMGYNPWESARLGEKGDFAHPWRVRLNARKAEFSKYVVNDSISTDTPNVKFIPETFRLVTGSGINENWNMDDSILMQEGVDYRVDFNSDYTQFTLTIFNAYQKPFILDYYTTAPGDGSAVGNLISVQGDDQQLPLNTYTDSTRQEVRRISRTTEGGAIQLNVAYRIVVNKVDAETKQPLAGAVFRVTDPDGNEFLLAPTDADGTTVSEVINDALAAKGTFKIQEVTAPEGYELSTDVTEVTVTETGVVRTIENKKRNTEFKATKVWSDNKAEADRPALKLQLKRDGQAYGEAKDVPKAGGEVAWTNLPYYQDGKTDPSVYTVEETGVEGTGYDVAYSDQTATSATVTNTYRTTEFKATKVWSDNKAEADRPALKLQLKRDGQAYGEAKDVPKAGGEVAWTNLPYYQDGKTDPSVYTVEETGLDATGYEVAYSDQTETTATVTNTYRTTEFKATKVWSDNKAEADRPALKLQLKRDGQAYGEAKDVPKAGGEVAWTNLPYYQDGKTDPSVYTVEETDVEGTGYDVAYTNQTATAATVTNTYRTTGFNAMKVWSDNQAAADRPNVKFQLKRDGQAYGEAKDVPKEGGLVSWTDLPYYQDGKNEASVYTVEELTETPNGYEVTYTSDANGTVTVTNTFRTTGFVANKVWAGDKTPASRPQATFQLYRDGVAYGQPQAVPTVDGQVAWTNLPYYQDGKNEASVYTVQEVQDVDSNYVASYTDLTAGSVTVTNTLENKTTTFTVNKQWREFQADMKRPNAKFQLKRDGVAYGELRDVPKEDGQVVWTDLPLYQDGTTEPSVYTVDELDPSNEGGFSWKVENLTATSATVVNTRKPVDNPPTPPGGRELPKTGEQHPVMTGLLGLSLLALAATFVVAPARRRG